MITIKDYAKKHNVSYEAVRQQINRYREELGEHIIKYDRTQYLDEEAEAFLDGKRASNPVIVYEASKDNRIEELEEEVKRLNALLQVRAGEISKLAERVLALTDAHGSDAEQTLLPDLEQERKARERAEEKAAAELEVRSRAEAELGIASDKIDEQKAQIAELTEDKQKAQEEVKSELEARVRAEEELRQARDEVARLKGRGFFARLFNT